MLWGLRRARPDGPLFTKRPRIGYPIFALLGGASGWFALYYSPLVMYRGAVAFINLYNAPGYPLLRYLPLLVGCVVSVLLGQIAQRIWRHIQPMGDRAEGGRNTIALVLASICLIGAVASFIIAGGVSAFLLREWRLTYG